MMADPYIHTPDDCRGPRIVLVNGKRVDRVTYADTRRGLIRYTAYPLRVNKREEVVERTRRGKVEVRPLNG
jgi:hypothetical protein